MSGPAFGAHARSRVREHYGLELSRFDCACILAAIRSRDARRVAFVAAHPHGADRRALAVYWVRWAGTRLLCLYDPESAAMVTVLHPRVTFLPSGRQDWAANYAAGVPGARPPQPWPGRFFDESAARSAARE